MAYAATKLNLGSITGRHLRAAADWHTSSVSHSVTYLFEMSANRHLQFDEWEDGHDLPVTCHNAVLASLATALSVVF